MGYPLCPPDVQVVAQVETDGSHLTTLRELCEAAGVAYPDLPGGERLVALVPLKQNELPWVRAEGRAHKPDGTIAIGVPPLDRTSSAQAQWALCSMAYTTVFDQFARAAVREQQWSRIDPDLFPELAAPRELVALARNTFETREEAWQWLSRQHPMLEDRTPLQCAKSDAGEQRVKDLLLTIKHGGVV